MSVDQSRFCGVELNQISYVTNPLVSAYNEYAKLTAFNWRNTFTYIKAAAAYPFLTLLFYAKIQTTQDKARFAFYKTCQELRSYNFSNIRQNSYINLYIEIKHDTVTLRFMPDFTQYKDSPSEQFNTKLNKLENYFYQKIIPEKFLSNFDLNVKVEVFQRIAENNYDKQCIEHSRNYKNTPSSSSANTHPSLAELKNVYYGSTLDAITNLKILNEPVFLIEKRSLWLQMLETLVTPLVSLLPASTKTYAKPELDDLCNDCLSRFPQFPEKSCAYIELAAGDTEKLSSVETLSNGNESLKRCIMVSKGRIRTDSLNQYPLSVKVVVVHKNDDNTYTIYKNDKQRNKDGSSPDGGFESVVDYTEDGAKEFLSNPDLCGLPLDKIQELLTWSNDA